MEDLGSESKWNDVLLIAGAIVLALILYAIGHQTTDGLVFLLLSAAALALGVPLVCASYPVSKSDRYFTWPRAGLAAFVSVAGITVTAVTGYFFSDFRYVSPALIGLAVVLPAYIRAR